MAKRKVEKAEKAMPAGRQVSKVSQTSKKEPLGVNPRGEPQTMEELLAYSGYQIRGLKRGQMISGIITQIISGAVLIDIGAKTEGIVADREFDAASDFIKTLKVGDQVAAQVYNPESGAGQILLSLKRTAFLSAWAKLGESFKQNEEVEARVLGVNRAGLLVEVYGLSGFIPGSQVASRWRGQEEKLIGQRVKAKIIDLNETANKLILSEKAVSEKEKLVQIEGALGKLEVGGEYPGVVAGITPFGVFVQISVGPRDKEVPVEGLVHISEVAWEKIDDLNALLKVGQEVKVKVIEVDQKAGKLALSLKQLQPDPWGEKVKKYWPDSIVSGKISRLTDFGAFVEIEPGLEGFLHASKIPAEQKMSVGEAVDCLVESIEPEKRRLALGLVLKAKPVGYK